MKRKWRSYQYKKTKDKTLAEMIQEAQDKRDFGWVKTIKDPNELKKRYKEIKELLNEKA